MEQEVKDILFETLKDRIDICEINNGEEDKYHKYFLFILPKEAYKMTIKIEISKDKFNKLKLYLERKKRS